MDYLLFLPLFLFPCSPLYLLLFASFPFFLFLPFPSFPLLPFIHLSLTPSFPSFSPSSISFPFLFFLPSFLPSYFLLPLLFPFLSPSFSFLFEFLPLEPILLQDLSNLVTHLSLCAYFTYICRAFFLVQQLIFGKMPIRAVSVYYPPIP